MLKGRPVDDASMEAPTGDAGIYARESSYLDRYVQLGEAGDRIISLSFPSQPEDDVREDHALLDRIDEYLQGAEDDFTDVNVGLTVPTKQRTVLDAVREIPYGEDASVAQVARMTPDLDDDDEDDIAQVREALAANPVPLLIPDHRVRDGPSAAPPPVEQKLRAIEDL
jgi:methylated-DNA-[protein]-cysteine S-methyltransferase